MLYISASINSQARASGKKIIGGNATEKALLEFVLPMKMEIDIKKKREIL